MSFLTELHDQVVVEFDKLFLEEQAAELSMYDRKPKYEHLYDIVQPEEVKKPKPHHKFTRPTTPFHRQPRRHSRAFVK